MGRKPCCSVGFGGHDHFPKGAAWTIHWLPKGYAITRDDRFLCAFPNPENGEWEDYGLGDEAPLPPLIKAVTDAIETYFAAHPEEAAVAGRFEGYAEAIRKAEAEREKQSTP